ncbi:MAG: adenosylcobinamide-GDP ribazoletransferase [Leptospira sp.]|uniref:adenosylcobinamide-GDP ribazoletransferase n=1 Tax=Leptospira sp. TaxID=178 RepID=UPI0025BBCC80|nr:adenosylcobinamide-GDP ribazoletransferase [Leptospira sp.]MBL0955418.1 adenosylcobinamide-GDP ribazoletransferase [Leptospira sp.]
MRYIALEIRLFFICLAFLTRIPSPSWIGFKEEWLHNSIKYSPSVGLLLGSIQFVLFLLFQFLFGPTIGFTISLGFLLILTGAFHEDGFSDFCDGIGGGWKREDILLIMKDSRVGSFGAVGICLLVLLKVLGANESFSYFQRKNLPMISNLTNNFHLISVWLYFVSAHTLSRFLSVFVMKLLPYAKEEGYAKPMAKEITWPQIQFASLLGVLPYLSLAYLHPNFFLSLLCIIPSYIYMVRLMKQWIQGFTGDCLGAVQQVVETCIWISGVFIWNFI